MKSTAAFLQMDVAKAKATSFFDIYLTFGWFYAKLGRLDDAEKLYDRALAGFEEVLGAEHKSTFDTVQYLALLYVDQGRLADAEQVYGQAGYERTLGANHSSTLCTIHNLGDLYRRQGCRGCETNV